MEHIEKLVDRVARGLNDRDWAVYGAAFTDNVIVHAPGLDTVGRDKRVEWVIGLTTAFPDGRIALQHAFQQDEWACAELTFEGTHTGPLVSGGKTIPPTNRRVGFPYCLVMRLENGLIAELHEYFDQVALLTQLGLLATT